MKIEKISDDSAAFIFDQLETYKTNVFTIERKSKIFLIDTFCGMESMDLIKQTLGKKFNKEIIIINTHFHWDHVWGNCAFKNSIIISHKLCREFLNKHWEEQLKGNRKYISGNSEKTLPNVTFEKIIKFENENIEIFYTPGHTLDSISVFDCYNKILYVGDNLEKPIIYVENNDIKMYIDTLEKYLSMKPEKIMAGHTLYLNKKDIFNTIKYLQDLRDGKNIEFEDEYIRNVHKENFNFINNKTLQ